MDNATVCNACGWSHDGTSVSTVKKAVLQKEGRNILFPSSAQIQVGRLPPEDWKVVQFWQGPTLIVGKIGSNEVVLASCDAEFDAFLFLEEYKRLAK